ncbi:hypothetical protein Bca4012_034297 [Brassica carinata]
MKNSFQPLLIGLFMITVILFGVMTIAQKRGPPHKFYPCSVKYQSKNGDCTKDDCKAECTRKKNGIGSCIGPPGRRWCACVYQKQKNNKCYPNT